MRRNVSLLLCGLSLSAVAICSASPSSELFRLMLAGTTYMDLTLPVPGVTPGPLYATEIVQAFTTIDSHNHTPGFGACIPSQATCIGATLPMNGQTLSDAGAVVFLNNASALPAIQADQIYSADSNGDLWFNDAAGHQIQITALGVVNGGGGGTTGGGTFILPVVFQASSVTQCSIDTSGDISCNGQGSFGAGAAVTGALSVTGSTTLTTLQTSALATESSLAVQGSAQFDGGVQGPFSVTIGPGGSSVFSVSSAGNAAISGTETVTGNATLLGSLAVTGPTSMSTLQTSGAASLNSLTCPGTAQFDGGIQAPFSITAGPGGAVVFNVDESGDLTLSGTAVLENNLNMGGHRITNGAAAINPTDFVILAQLQDAGGGTTGGGGGLACVAEVTYPDAGGGGTLAYFDCAGNGDFPNTLFVDGGITDNGALVVGGNLTEKGSATVAGTLAVTGAITANGNPGIVGNNFEIPDAVTANVWGRFSSFSGISHSTIQTENMSYDAGGGVWCEDDNTQAGLLSLARSEIGFYWDHMPAGACTAAPMVDMAITPGSQVSIQDELAIASTTYAAGTISAEGNPGVLAPNGMEIPDATASGVFGRNGSAQFTGLGNTYEQSENYFFDGGGAVTCADNPAYVGLNFVETGSSQPGQDAGFYWAIVPPGGCVARPPVIATLLTTGDFSTSRSITSPQITATTAATMASASVTGLAIDGVLQVDGGVNVRLGNITFTGSNNQIQWDAGSATVYISYPGPNTPALSFVSTPGGVLRDATSGNFDGFGFSTGIGSEMFDSAGDSAQLFAGLLNVSTPIVASPATDNAELATYGQVLAAVSGSLGNVYAAGSVIADGGFYPGSGNVYFEGNAFQGVIWDAGAQTESCISAANGLTCTGGGRMQIQDFATDFVRIQNGVVTISDSVTDTLSITDGGANLNVPLGVMAATKPNQAPQLAQVTAASVVSVVGIDPTPITTAANTLLGWRIAPTTETTAYEDLSCVVQTAGVATGGTLTVALMDCGAPNASGFATSCVGGTTIISQTMSCTAVAQVSIWASSFTGVSVVAGHLIGVNLTSNTCTGVSATAPAMTCNGSYHG